MTLGICLLLIFILYLIDKHNRWRQLVKVVIWLVGIGVVVVGGVFGWAKYEDYKASKANEAYQAKMQPFWDCTSRNAQFTNAEEECKKNPAVVLRPITIKPDAPRFTPIPNPTAKTRPAFGWAVVSQEYAEMRKRCAFNVGTWPCGIGAEEGIATLHKGDRVQLLSRPTRAPDGNDICEIHFEQWTGWVVAKFIAPDQN
jgi:hypothetical protein